MTTTWSYWRGGDFAGQATCEMIAKHYCEVLDELPYMFPTGVTSLLPVQVIRLIMIERRGLDSLHIVAYSTIPYPA